MDARDRLWIDVIFPLCEPAPTVLLSLRAVCRAFKERLDASYLWLPWTMVQPRMRYDERTASWPGVVRAMQREENTHRNCVAGRFGFGPRLVLPFVRALMIVAGRIAAFCGDGVKLYCVETGAQLAAFDDTPHWMETNSGRCVVLDRWIPFCTSHGRALLLDCVAGTLVEVMPGSSHRFSFTFSIAGMFLSHRTSADDDATYTIVRVEGGRDNSTVVHDVACVRHPHSNVLFALCELGKSFLLLDRRERTLQLVDLATRKPKRVFSMRK